MSAFDIDDFDNPSPTTQYLYKYLSVDRMSNVLDGGTVRFTALLSTNDSFEVRSTFRKLAGPRSTKMLANEMKTAASEEKAEEMITEKLQDMGPWILTA